MPAACQLMVTASFLATVRGEIAKPRRETDARRRAGPRRYKPHFVGAVRPFDESWRTDKHRQHSSAWPRSAVARLVAAADLRLQQNRHALLKRVTFAKRIAAKGRAKPRSNCAMSNGPR